MNQKFVALLEELDNTEELDEGRGRPKKEVDPDAPVKEKGKRGRPKKEKSDDDFYDDEDDNESEGVRTVTLTAKIKIDGEKQDDETKVLKNIKVSTIDDEIDKWEKSLHKKYDYEADITISKKIGDYDVNNKAEDQTKDDEGSDSEDDTYSIGNTTSK